VEVVDDTAIALPPLDDVLAGGLIDQTQVSRLLAGFRGRKPADRGSIIRALNALSHLIVDYPFIVAADVNPLLADAEGVIALDVRFEIDPETVEQPGPNPALIIRPYPAEWARDVTVRDQTFHVRPIRPADAALYPDFFEQMDKEDMRLRFFSLSKHFSDKLLIRLTQLDYDREMAFVALDRDGNLCGVARIFADPDHETAEYALLVRSDLKGQGLGWTMLRHLLDFAKADGLKRVYGTVLSENSGMLKMCREFGFQLAVDKNDPGIVKVSLDLLH
jgi:acetyltransferase